jgi:hypothetical protein
MPEVSRVITSFVVYSGEEIVAQGSFQVHAEQGSNTFASSDGTSFRFEHSCEDSVCFVDVFSVRQAAVQHSYSLEIPINRPKIKWKNLELGVSYRLYYRSAFDTPSDRELKRSGTRKKGPELTGFPDDA